MNRIEEGRREGGKEGRTVPDSSRPLNDKVKFPNEALLFHHTHTLMVNHFTMGFYSGPIIYFHWE